ncbi:hypothetical protein [Gordonia sp. VNK1]|uniref:hypothetical protein n=1 Tax=Gordonia oleivorans TaxID=3156618 RepID=UPI0032B33EC1
MSASVKHRVSWVKVRPPDTTMDSPTGAVSREGCVVAPALVDPRTDAVADC